MSSVEQAFVGRDEKQAPLKTPAWEARILEANSCVLFDVYSDHACPLRVLPIMRYLSFRQSWSLRYFLARSNVCPEFLAVLSLKRFLNVSSLPCNRLIEQKESGNVFNWGKYHSIRPSSPHISGEATRLFQSWREKRGR